MKKKFPLLTGILLCFLFRVAAQVSVEAFPMNPQTGQYNYFGVRVTLHQVYDRDMTVEGYIQEEDNPGSRMAFTLTITAGNLSAETAPNYFAACPACGAETEFGTLTTAYAGVSITYEPGSCILRFNSFADLLAVINQLDAETEDYNDEYENQNSNLSEDELDDLDEQTAFDEFKKYRDFEMLFGGFCSKRSEIESVENTWLANNFSGTDPDNLDLTYDDAENTIFNYSYSVKVGADVFQLTENGFYKNGVLLDIGGENSAIFQQPVFPGTALNGDYAVALHGPNSWLADGPLPILQSAGDPWYPTPCKSNKKKKESAIYSSNTRRMDLKIAINSFWAFSSVKAKAVSYKKKNGNWKRARTKLAVGCGGTVYQGDCGNSFQFTTRKPSSGFKKRKHLKAPYRSQAQVPGVETNWKTYSGQIAGTVDAPDLNFNGTVILTW